MTSTWMANIRRRCYALRPWRYAPASYPSLTVGTSSIASKSLPKRCSRPLRWGRRPSEDGWIDQGFAIAIKLRVDVREPATSHTITLSQVERWLDGATSSPDGRVRKDRLREFVLSDPSTTVRVNSP